jgi:hypothetical protein
MNIQLANIISDLSGWTGQRIVRREYRVSWLRKYGLKFMSHDDPVFVPNDTKCH